MQLDDLKANNPCETNISWEVFDLFTDQVDKKAAILKCGLCKGPQTYTIKKK